MCHHCTAAIHMYFIGHWWTVCWLNGYRILRPRGKENQLSLRSNKHSVWLSVEITIRSLKLERKLFLRHMDLITVFVTVYVPRLLNTTPAFYTHVSVKGPHMPCKIVPERLKKSKNTNGDIPPWDCWMLQDCSCEAIKMDAIRSFIFNRCKSHDERYTTTNN